MSASARHRSDTRDGRNVTLLGMVVNAGLCALKISAGVWGNSQALIADGVHSISDMATDLAVLVGMRYWSEPADTEHPYGHRRIETLITVGVAATLAGVAVLLTLNALKALNETAFTVPRPVALLAALISLVAKEIVYRLTVRAGRALNSPALIANAWHHRSDALSSIPPALAVGAALVSEELAVLDPLAAILVSLIILRVSGGLFASAFRELADRGAPADVRQELEQLAGRVEGVKEVHALRTRRMAGGWTMDLHVLVNPHISVQQGHDIATEVNRVLREEGPNVVDVLVHVEPASLSEKHAKNDRGHGDETRISR